MSDDLRFTPPEPKTGMRVQFMLQRGPDGAPIVDSIIDPPRHPTRAELEAELGTPRGSLWTCGCTAIFRVDGTTRELKRCEEHRNAKSPPA